MIDEKTILKMQVYGGSFVRTLAELYVLADAENRAKLEKCFAEIFEKYRRFEE